MLLRRSAASISVTAWLSGQGISASISASAASVARHSAARRSATRAGAADAFTVVFRGAIIAAVAPDRLRGRVMAADYVIGAGGGQLGSLEAGALGSLASPMISALSGGELIDGRQWIVL